MALIIRMRQQGAARRHCFRLVVTDLRKPRDGKYTEKLGWYDPFLKGDQNYVIDLPRLQYWVAQGAQVSERVQALVERISPETVKEWKARQVAKREKKRVKRKQAKSAS